MTVDVKKIRKGRKKVPDRVLIYGPDGIGKTTFASGAPKPLVLDANKGSFKLNVDAVPIESWTEVVDWVSAVADGKVPCETLVLDDMSTLEVMSHMHIFPAGTTVADYKGGYGKGDEAVIPKWRELLSILEKVVFVAGKRIVLVAHARIRKHEDPMGGGYDRYELACRPPLAGLLRQWVDFVLFAQLETAFQKTEEGARKGVTTGARYIHTRRDPAYDAKARGSMVFPARLPLSWQEFAIAVENDDKLTSGDLHKEIDAMLAELSDPDLEKQVREWIAQHPDGIVETRTRVAARLEEARRKKAP